MLQKFLAIIMNVQFNWTLNSLLKTMLSSVTNNFLRKSALIINNEVLSHIQYIHVYSVYGFYSTMLYAIVSFDATDETDFLPLKWIASDMTVHDIPQIAESQIVSNS
jgi:hypothetical protein